MEGTDTVVWRKSWKGRVILSTIRQYQNSWERWAFNAGWGWKNTIHIEVKLEKKPQTFLTEIFLRMHPMRNGQLISLSFIYLEGRFSCHLSLTCLTVRLLATLFPIIRGLVTSWICWRRRSQSCRQSTRSYCIQIKDGSIECRFTATDSEALKSLKACREKGTAWTMQ